MGSAAAVAAAGVAMAVVMTVALMVAVVVVVAGGLHIAGQIACQQGLHSRVGVAGRI